MKVLVTGGAGYVGSTICSALLDCGITPVILDTLETGRDEFVDGKIFYQGDIADRTLLKKVFTENPDIEYTVDCAEKAAIEQSVISPYEYYYANVFKSMALFKCLIELGCRKLVFSSSSSFYDDVPGYMVNETSPINPRNPFSRSKYMTELILKDFCIAYGLRCIALRYFNPIGADPRLRSGMQPKNPVNIVGRLLRVIGEEEPAFKIYGQDWGTRDGTCIRDYVHVWDVAMAHVKAVQNFDSAFDSELMLADRGGFLPINVGSGVGVTVKEFVFAFENITGEKVNVVFAEHRPGDVSGCYANITRAKNLIGWEAAIPIEEAILDAVRWEEKRGDDWENEGEEK